LTDNRPSNYRGGGDEKYSTDRCRQDHSSLRDRFEESNIKDRDRYSHEDFDDEGVRRKSYSRNRYDDMNFCDGNGNDRHRSYHNRSERYYSEDETYVSTERDDFHRSRSRSISRHSDNSRRRDDCHTKDERKRSPSPQNHHSRHYRHRRRNCDDNDDDYNYKERVDEENNSRRQRKTEEFEWPPSFEKDGSAFVFDSRSAMFYEPLSDFFYCPKSKLYYGNKKKTYFRYEKTKKPPFVQVQKITTKELEQHGENGGVSQEIIINRKKDDVANDKNQASIVSKPKIAIKLKTKKVKSSSTVTATTTESTATTISRVKKEQIANIEKWTEKQVELKQSDDFSKTETTKVRTTAKGEPICFVCRRKFPSTDKLRLHEKSSELHKKNLLKLQEKEQRKDSCTKRQIKGKSNNTANPDEAIVIANGNGNTNTPFVEYTDRAEKRRRLHGLDSRALANGIPSLRRRPDGNTELSFVEPQRQDPITTTTAPGSDFFNETNVGHQMLQRMGRKGSSTSLSDQQQQQQNHYYGSDSSRRTNTSSNPHLRKEWDRIEAMAANNSIPRNRSKF